MYRDLHKNSGVLFFSDRSKECGRLKVGGKQTKGRSDIHHNESLSTSDWGREKHAEDGCEDKKTRRR